MDARIRVVLQEDGTYRVPHLKVERTHCKSLGNVIREGYAIKVTTYLDDVLELDITRETLVRIAMFPHPGAHEKQLRAVLTALETAESVSLQTNLPEDVLYLIIENGGIDEYLTRKARGLVQYETRI